MIGALPRIQDALRNPLIFDEIYGVFLARSGFAGMLRTLGQDVDQPLNFIVIWAWRALGGEGELWLKIPALIFAVATVAVVGFLGRAMFGAPAGLLAAALVALHPSHVFYSSQARFHSMVWFLLLCCVWAGWSWVRGAPSVRGVERDSAAPAERRRLDRSGAWAGAGILLTTAAALYTDWFSVFVLGAIAAWGAFSLRAAPRRLAAWVGLFGLGVLLYAPQIPTLVQQIARDIEGEKALPPMPAAEVVELFRKLSFNASYLILPLAALAAIALLRPATRRPASMLALIVCVGILLPWGLSVAGIHLFINRQMLFTLPLACLLIAAGITSFGPRAVHVLGALAIVALAGRACFLRTPLEETVELPRALAHVRSQAGPASLIVGCETRALLFFRHYMPEAETRLLVTPETEPFHYSDGILIFPDHQVISPAELRGRRTPWWGVRLQHAGRDGPAAAAAIARMASEERRFGRVTVWKVSD